MDEPVNISIDDPKERERLDKTLARHLPNLSRSRLKALIQSGHVLLTSAGRPATITSPSHMVKPPVHISVTFPPATDPEPQAQNIDLHILYEDADLVVVNKPAGMVVHPAPGAESGTLVNALLHHCHGSLSGIGGVRRPGIVHRIDKDTSGILVVAKHDQAHHGLADQFQDHSISRRYLALCRGHLGPAKGRIEGAIGRHPVDRKKMTIREEGGKSAVTHYQVQDYYSVGGTAIATKVECQLETGRTHQVRVHMASRGHALIGDQVYGRNLRLPSHIDADLRGAIMSFKRQALHARSLGFIHPISGAPLQFECDPPHDLIQVLKKLENYK